MKKSRQSKRAKKQKTGFLFYLFLIFVLFAISTGASYHYFKPSFTFESSFIDKFGARRLEDRDQDKKEGSLRLYKSSQYAPSMWYDSGSRKDTLLNIAENVIRRYIKPYSVRLLDLYMDKEGIIYIDLSDGLRKNFKGDAFEEFSIIAGLYRSIKTTIPDFTALQILIEGREADSFGGHIDISKPIGEEVAGDIR